MYFYENFFMYRTVNNGQLRKEDVGRDVIMCGWVQKSRDLGGMTFIDLRALLVTVP